MPNNNGYDGEAWREEEPSFAGARPPVWEMREKPWHSTAVFAFAKGMTAKELARHLGKSQLTVGNLLKQPWFQRRVQELLKELGEKDGIMELIRAEAMNNVQTLVELRDSPKVPAHVRANCAVDMLDRTLGKATQHVETKHENVSGNPVEEAARLEAECKRLMRDLGMLPSASEASEGEQI